FSLVWYAVSYGFIQAVPTGRPSSWDSSHVLRCCYIVDARTRCDAPVCLSSGDSLVCRECTWRVVAHVHIPTGASRMTANNKVTGASAGERLGFAVKSRVVLRHRPGGSFHR